MINHSLTTNLELQIKLMNKFEYRHWLRPIEYLQNANYAYEIFSTGLDTLSLESLLSVELSDKEIRYLTAQLVCAIDSLHREGYYHSNIHPKAFVLCDDGILRMTNMFYAKKIENGKKKEKIEGGLPLDKHIFMAP
jgi:serine/threonine protein kinase